ncbi:MAG: class I SAM-dependent methyltransferase [Burkholderiaceae bacterium]|nr:class I SAM-dependent methyltransferase [Gammaproteobacteria bacterium]
MAHEMFQYTASVLDSAEKSSSVAEALPILRRIGLDDFGLFLASIPNPDYPNLSKMLPHMASEEIQREWTGLSGVELLKTSVAFMRLLESICIRHADLSLFGKRVLDFGCGYGRLIRLLYYYTDPENIIGVDAWEKSLNFCQESRILASLLKTESVPTPLSCEVDLAYAFSVLTHTSAEATRAILRAVRPALTTGGLFVVTIRPIEFWQRINKRTPVPYRELEHAHRESGFAFIPHPKNPHYGDTSMNAEFLDGADWEVVGVERSLIDPVQLVVTLRAR